MADHNIDQTTGEVLDVDLDSGKQIEPFNASTGMIGVIAESGWTHAEKVAALAAYTEAVTAPSERIDDYLNMVIRVTGCFQHSVEVRNSSDYLVPAIRTVIMIDAVAGEELQNVKNVSMVSITIAKAFRETFIPLLGSGTWEEPVYMRFKKVPTKKGQTFTVRVLKDWGLPPRGYNVTQE